MNALAFLFWPVCVDQLIWTSLFGQIRFAISFCIDRVIDYYHQKRVDIGRKVLTS